MQIKYRLLIASFLAASLWAMIWYPMAALLVVAPWYVHGEVEEYPGNYAPL